jgi:hypothetical protein
MKKFYLFYSVFSVMFLSTVYFFTLVQGSQQRSLILFSELAEEAYETKDMTPFIKYQSVAYNHLDSTIVGDYQMESYQVIEYSNGEYVNQFIIYVLPLVDVTYATSIDDEMDETGIYIYKDGTSEIILDTYQDPIYQDKAISFGIKSLGFYYYHTTIEIDKSLNISLYDYQGDMIFSKIIEFDYIEYSPDSGQMELGYTKEELEDLLDLNNFIRVTLIRNITIFLVADVFLGAAIVFIVKKKKP